MKEVEGGLGWALAYCGARTAARLATSLPGHWLWGGGAWLRVPIWSSAVLPHQEQPCRGQRTPPAANSRAPPPTAALRHWGPPPVVPSPFSSLYSTPYRQQTPFAAARYPTPPSAAERASPPSPAAPRLLAALGSPPTVQRGPRPWPSSRESPPQPLASCWRLARAAVTIRRQPPASASCMDFLERFCRLGIQRQPGRANLPSATSKEKLRPPCLMVGPR